MARGSMDTRSEGEVLMVDGDRPMLLAQGLTHRFPGPEGAGRTVLSGIDLAANRAEFISVMGPSGCGKTTLLNLVAGFLSVQEGVIEVNGEPVQGASPDRGVVFQRPHLFPWLTVLDNVMFGPRALGWPRSRARADAEALLGEVGLAEYPSSYPHELSGGMQHRAAIARTLVTNPPVLLMDEPFAALDAQTRSDMQALLLGVWERHRPTVLFVTHDIEEGLLLSDRVVVLGSHPGMVIENIDVPFPRPRPVDVIFEENFIQLRSRIRGMMRRQEPNPPDPGPG